MYSSAAQFQSDALFSTHATVKSEIKTKVLCDTWCKLNVYFFPLHFMTRTTCHLVGAVRITFPFESSQQFYSQKLVKRSEVEVGVSSSTCSAHRFLFWQFGENIHPIRCDDHCVFKLRWSEWKQNNFFLFDLFTLLYSLMMRAKTGYLWTEGL